MALIAAHLNAERDAAGQRTGFNTLDNWGHKTPTQSKKDKGQERKVKRSWPETCIQYTRLQVDGWFLFC